MSGKHDPDCRRAFPWDKPDTWDKETLAYHKQLIAVRHAHPALRRGRYQLLDAGDLTVAYSRALDDDKVMVALNVGDKAAKVDVPVTDLFPDGTHLKAVYGKANVTVEGGSVKLTIPARDGLVLAKAE